ncbi:DVU3141 family protein [Salinicola peritrichatus]|uniref:DVU3141 family protein n=1 Tax=Salinicola peritrichatus TaxID=1267424 RepID=UPI001EF8EB0C|nr:DVU3141 family protein [Salinicola peritrichatus]
MYGATPTGEQVSAFLDNATPGSIATFPKSPWGSNVSVIVQDRYFAASGRLCTHLDVAREGAPPSAQQAQLACLVGDAWYTQRLVTQALAAPSNR